MRKTVNYILSLLIIMTVTSVSAGATDTLTRDLSEKLFSSMDGEIVEALENFGIYNLDYENIYKVSLNGVFEYYRDTFADLLTGSIRLFMKLLSLVILTGITSMILKEEKYKTLISYLASAAAVITVVDDINLCLSSAVSLVNLCGKFILAFAPVYAVIIAVSGNPATALTYNTLVLSFAEVSSGIINGVMTGFMGCFFCLTTSLSVSDTLNADKLISATNRAFSFVLGLVSSLFASLLTVKGIFSSSVDTVTSKGIRFAIGSLIPVIGSSISDAYSSLVGSINIIKSSVAVIGIFAIFLMSLPVVAEIMLFRFSLSSISFVSEMFDCGKLTLTFRGFACGVRIIGLICVFEVFMLIISTALMLSFKGG